MKCPLCGCEEFYIKDPDDEYELYEFSCKDGAIVFQDGVDAQGAPPIDATTETYCNQCAWHGRKETLK